ncbi:MAG: hypothetical protein EXR45_02245 [Chloroflexi bacterium]|nr:hypothetical protein [Chloroflexota bacterium]
MLPRWANRRTGAWKRVRVVRLAFIVRNLMVVFDVLFATSQSGVVRDFEHSRFIGTRTGERFSVPELMRTRILKVIEWRDRLRWILARRHRTCDAKCGYLSGLGRGVVSKSS